MNRKSLLFYQVIGMLLLLLSVVSCSNSFVRYTQKEKIHNHKVLIFVHGITNKPKATWTNSDNDAYWPKLLIKDGRFNDYDIYAFEGGDVSSNPSQPHTIDQLGQILNLRLEEENIIARDEGKKNYDSLTFIGHSLGNLIIRSALEDEKYSEIYSHTSVPLVLAIAPPFNPNLNNFKSIIEEEEKSSETKWITINSESDLILNNFKKDKNSQPQVACLFVKNSIKNINLNSPSFCTRKPNELDGEDLSLAQPKDKNDKNYMWLAEEISKKIGIKEVEDQTEIIDRLKKDIRDLEGRNSILSDEKKELSDEKKELSDEKDQLNKKKDKKTDLAKKQSEKIKKLKCEIIKRGGHVDTEENGVSEEEDSTNGKENTNIDQATCKQYSTTKSVLEKEYDGVLDEMNKDKKETSEKVAKLAFEVGKEKEKESNFSEAALFFEDAIKYLPKNKENAKNEISYLLFYGNVLYQQGKFEEAKEQNRITLEKTNDHYGSVSAEWSLVQNNQGASWSALDGINKKTVQFYKNALGKTLLQFRTQKLIAQLKKERAELEKKRALFLDSVSVENSMENMLEDPDAVKTFKKRADEHEADLTKNLLLEQTLAKILEKGNIPGAPVSCDRKEKNNKQKQVVSVYWENLGRAVEAFGENQQALEYYEKALDCAEQFYDKKDPALTLYWNDLGRIHAVLKTKKSKEYFYKILKHDFSGFSLQPKTSAHLRYIGNAFYFLKQHKQAISYYRKALKEDRGNFGINNPSVALDWSKLGDAWKALGNEKEAVLFYGKSLQVYQDNLGEKHPTTQRVKDKLFSLMYDIWVSRNG